MKFFKVFTELIIVIFFISAFFCSSAAQSINFHWPGLEQRSEEFRFGDTPLQNLRFKQVDSLLHILKSQFPRSFHFTQTGKSVENRPIYLVRLGTGKIKVLLWSQMHGNEPTATAALLDIFNYLMNSKEDKFVKTLLDSLTILAVPMLNPDGAEKFTRRNAQGLDVNRDARDLQSPEGRILFDLQKKYKPDFGFNLHDQNARRTVGKSNKLVAIALMAPPFDLGDNDNPVRIRAKKVISVIHNALGPYLYGHIAKYDAEYMPRAFGDSMQNWGVSTILIESGGWFENRYSFLRKMNFIAIISAFRAIATGEYQGANPAIYEQLQQNDKNIYDLFINDVMLLDGTGGPPFLTDLAINFETVNKTASVSEKRGIIADIGDMNFFAAKDTINGQNFWLTPGFITVLKQPHKTIDKMFDQISDLLLSGFTTVLVPFYYDQTSQSKLLRSKIDFEKFPGNVGGLLRVDNNPAILTDTLTLVKAVGSGFMGIIEKKQKSTSVITRWFNKPSVIWNEIEENYTPDSLNAGEISRLTAFQANRWKLSKRGKIRIGQIADLILFARDSTGRIKIKTIFIKGYPVMVDKKSLYPAVLGDRWLPGLK